MAQAHLGRGDVTPEVLNRELHRFLRERLAHRVESGGGPTQADIDAAFRQVAYLTAWPDLGSWPWCAWKILITAMGCIFYNVGCGDPPTCTFPKPKPKPPCGGPCPSPQFCDPATNTCTCPVTACGGACGEGCPPCMKCDAAAQQCVPQVWQPQPGQCQGQCCTWQDVTDPNYTSWDCKPSTPEACKIDKNKYPTTAVSFDCAPWKLPGC